MELCEWKNQIHNVEQIWQDIVEVIDMNLEE
jgi:hypothetical protein